MRNSRLFAVCVLMLVHGCDRAESPAESPALVDWEIWHGDLDVFPGPIAASRVFPNADGTLGLRANTRYTGRATVSTAGNHDRCIYQVFRLTWGTPSRSFSCHPETDRRLVVTEEIPTWTSDLGWASPPENYYIEIAIAEYNITSRTRLNEYVVQRIRVQVN